MRRIIDETFDHAITILTERRDLLERTAKRLLEKETLDEADLKGMLEARQTKQADAAHERPREALADRA